MENCTHILPSKKEVYGADQYVVENSGPQDTEEQTGLLSEWKQEKKPLEKNVNLGQRGSVSLPRNSS